MSTAVKWLFSVTAAGLGLVLLYFVNLSFSARNSYRTDLQQFRVSDQKFESSQQVVIAELGYRLFREKSLSLDGKVACESCHLEESSFADTKAFSEGLATTQLNAPALVNMGFQRHFFWDGRADSLAAQALEPVENPDEHGFSRLGLAYILLKKHSELYEYAFGPFPKDLADYLRDFTEVPHAYPKRADLPNTLATGHRRPQTEQNPDWIANYQALSPRLQQQLGEVFLNFGRALAWYQRGLLAINSPFDAFLKQYNPEAAEPIWVEGFGVREWQGLQLFIGKAGCVRCHGGPLLSDQEFHFTGIALQKSPGRLAGLALYEANPYKCLDSKLCEKPTIDADSDPAYQQKTPSLRNVALTAPYMHDGSLADLRAVLERYNQPPQVDGQDPRIEGLDLSSEELTDLEAFLRSLSSPVRDLGQEWVGY